MVQKQKEKETQNKDKIKSINLGNIKMKESMSEEMLDAVKDLDNESRFSKTNFKITNITNYIMGPKSFDIKTKANDIMLRDIKALHLITQKALSTHSKQNPIDSIDDERKSFCKFQNINTKKALFIDDNSDLPSGIGKENSVDDGHSEYSQSFTAGDAKPIINIININNNYNIGSINMPTVKKNSYNFNHVNNYYPFNTSSQQSKNSEKVSHQSNNSIRSLNINSYKKKYTQANDAAVTPSQTPKQETVYDSSRSNLSNFKTMRKLIPKNTASKDLEGNTSNNKSIKDIINSVKKQPKKEKFIKLSK